MKLVLVSSSLGCGGAERVLSTLSNHWAMLGHEVGLVTLSESSTDFYKLDSRVKRIGLGLARQAKSKLQGFHNNLVRVKALRKLLHEFNADVVLSFCDRVNIITLLASYSLTFPVIVSERVDPSQIRIGVIWEGLRHLSYQRASAIVVQTERVRTYLKSYLPSDTIHVIPNPIQPKEKKNDWSWDQIRRPFKIISIGRLTHQKGFDLLIRAFAMFSQRTPNCILSILGEGPLLAELKSLVESLNVHERVAFLGNVNAPERLLLDSDLFVLASRFEGFPNALLEAMAIGLPVISFDCPSGPREIITHLEDGLLVPPEDVAQMADAIAALERSESERSRLGNNATRIVNRFHIGAISNQWLELMTNLQCSRP